MPVRKFRSVADMPGAQRRTPLDPENLRLACSLTQFAYWLHPMKHIPGVRKYRSVEEAWQARKEWVRSQLRRPSAQEARRQSLLVSRRRSEKEALEFIEQTADSRCWE